MMHEIKVLNLCCRDSSHNYETIKMSKELNDTSRWKHKWSLDFNKLKANVEFKEEEQYIEWYMDSLAYTYDIRIPLLIHPCL